MNADAFTGKTIFITGAATGLGRSLALALNQQGAQLVVMSRNQKMLEKAVSDFERVGKRPLMICGDVTHPKECETAVQQTIHHFGQLDHMILNAGISMWTRFEELSSLDIIQKTMATNYIGAVNCTFYALPYLKKTRGLITVISSIQGKIGVPFHTGYAASKHALHGFFDSLRLESNGDIDILMVCPSWIHGTELKKRAFYANNAPDQKTLSKHKKSGLNLPDCADKIISAMKSGRRELILPHKYSFIPLLKMFAPAWLDRIILAKSV